MAGIDKNILEVQGLLDKVNATLSEQISLYNTLAETTTKYGEANKKTIPSDFIKVQKELEETNKRLADSELKLIELEKKLSENKGRNTKLTIEEKVNRRALNQELEKGYKANTDLLGSYSKLNAQVAIARQRLLDLKSSTTASNSEIRKAQKEFDVLQKRVLSAEKAVGIWNRTGERTIKLGKELIGAFGIATGVGIFAGLTNNIYENIKAQQSLDLALKSVTGTSAEYIRAQNFLSDISSKYGLEINNLTKQYTAFYVAAKDKLSDKTIEQIFEDISRSGMALGLSNENLERSFMAVNQMLSKGTVASEELRGQLSEAMPGAVQAMTKAVQILHPELKNLTEKDLFDLIKQGKILASEVLPETAKQLALITGATQAEGIGTLTKGINQLSNAWKNFIKELEDGDGTFSKFLSRTAQGAANILKWTTNALKSASELRKEELQAYRSDLYKQELDDLQALGAGAKAEALKRKPLVQQQLADESALVEKLKLRLKTQQEGSSAYKQTAKEIRAANNDAYGSAGQLDAINKVLADNSTKSKKENTKGTREQIEAIKLLKGTSDSLIVSLENEIKFYEELRDKATNTSKEFDDFNKIVKALKSSLDFMKDPSKYLKGETDSLVKQQELLQKHKESWEEIEKAMQSYSDSFVDSFVNNSGFETTFDILSGKILGFGYDAKVTTTAIMESFQEMYNFISEASAKNYDAEFEQLEKRKTIALAFVGDSETARAEIEKQAEEKRKEIARREFNAKKEQARFNIIIDTAQAVVAALPNIPLSIIIGILGAVQLAKVNAQQPPEFWKGTDNAPEGLAWTQERGAEVITDKKGRVKTLGSNKGAVLTKLDAGDKVYTAQKSKQLMFNSDFNEVLFNSSLSNMMQSAGIGMSDSKPQIDIRQDLHQLGKDVVSAINNKTEYHQTFDGNGIKNYISNGHTTKEIKNNHVTFKQQSV